MLNKSKTLPESSMEKQGVNDILKVRFYRKNNIKKEDETVKRQLRNIIVSAVALSMIIPAIAAPELQAASKPKLSATKVSVKVGKTKKVTVKGVKAKKIKKTSWSVKSKKIAALSKKKKNSVTIKGKTAGSTKLTAKIKVGKKTYKKTCTVKVSGGDSKPTTNGGTTPTASSSATPTPPSGDGATPTPSSGAQTQTPTPVPLRPLDQSYLNAKAPNPISKDDLSATTLPDPTVAPDEVDVYEDHFEDLEVGTKTATEGDDAGEKATDRTAECENGLNRWVLRGFEADGPTGKDYLEIVPASEVPASNHDDYKNEGTGNVLKCHRDPGSKSWQGPMLNLTGVVEPGATYFVDVWVYAQASKLNFNEQVQAADGTDDSYAYLPARIESQRWLSKTNAAGQGAWSHYRYPITVPDDMNFYGFYFQSDDGTVGDIYVDHMTITKTGVVAQDKSIPKIKDTYSDIFDIVSTAAGAGEILGPSSIDFLTDQFNAVTAGNELKPISVMKESSEVITIEEAKEKGIYISDELAKKLAANKDNIKDDEVKVPDLDFTIVDRILEVCHERGLKFRGHTLCWHEQTPTYFFQKGWSAAVGAARNTSAENMDLRLEYFVKACLKHVLEKDLELAGGDKSKCVLYAYDVVNEYLHSSRPSSTFYHTIYKTIDGNTTSGVTLQPSYVKNAFTWADEMLKECGREDVKLFYNDFNCYDVPEDIVHLIDFINSDGQVCDGLGMQTHLTVGDSAHSADKYAKALECFRLNMPDMEIHVTEWDATQGSGDDLDQAVYYDQIAGTIMENKQKGGKITAIVIWGLKDGTSWRASGNPLLFKGLYSPKAAFYSFIDAKERYWKKN